MGDKFEMFKVIYSRYGFREHRNSRYRLDIVIKNERQSLYYDSFKNLLSFVKSFNRFLE